MSDPGDVPTREVGKGDSAPRMLNSTNFGIGGEIRYVDGNTLVYGAPSHVLWRASAPGGDFITNVSAEITVEPGKPPVWSPDYSSPGSLLSRFAVVQTGWDSNPSFGIVLLPDDAVKDAPPEGYVEPTERPEPSVGDYPHVRVLNTTPFDAGGQVGYLSWFCSDDNYGVNSHGTWLASSRGVCLVNRVSAQLSTDKGSIWAEDYTSS